jgi:hypothetical protein
VTGISIDELVARTAAAVGHDPSGVNPRPSNNGSSSDTTAGPLPDDCPAPIRRMIEQAEDRSKAHQALVLLAVGIGVDDDKIVSYVRHFPPSVEKYVTDDADNLEREVRRSIGKARQLLKSNPDLAAAYGAYSEGDDDDRESWVPVDLGPAWRGEKVWPPATVFPRDDGLALIPPGINYNHGDSGDGKSLLAAIVTLTELRAGRAVVWVTYEDANEEVVVERLRQLGATWEEVERLQFFAATEVLSDGIDPLVELVHSTGALFLVLDSIGEAMAVGNVNEDKDNEVGPWFRQTLRRLHEACPDLAVWPIDHSTKAKDNPLFPSGSKRKRAAVTGRAYLLHVRQPFGVSVVGHVQLVVAKDRNGRFKRGDIAAEITLDATSEPYTWTVRAPRDGDSYNPKVRRRTAAERVQEVLGEAAVPLTAEEITRIANGPDRMQHGEAAVSIHTVKNTLTKLARGPEISQIRGEKVDGKLPPSTWQRTCPDRDGTDDQDRE